MDLNARLRALEDEAATDDDEVFMDPAYNVGLNREILERRAIPLPPLDGVDLDATAELWARDGERGGFVMNGGEVVTSAELCARYAAAREKP